MSEELERDVSNGNEAADLLNNPQFKSACLRIRADLLGAFESSSFKEQDERTEIWRKLQALGAIEKELQHVIDTGKMSEMTLLERLTKKIRD